MYVHRCAVSMIEQSIKPEKWIVVDDSSDSKSYDIIKKLTRGKELSEESYRNLIENLPINEVDKTKLLKLTPIQYTGLASYLAKLK